ncbi:hypothetical protein CYMTET_52160, partial [Cymbomonas tetramitiformis]
IGRLMHRNLKLSASPPSTPYLGFGNYAGATKSPATSSAAYAPIVMALGSLLQAVEGAKSALESLESESSKALSKLDARMTALEGACERTIRSQENELAAVAEDATTSLRAAMDAIKQRDAQLARARASAASRARQVEQLMKQLGEQHEVLEAQGALARRNHEVELLRQELKKAGGVTPPGMEMSPQGSRGAGQAGGQAAYMEQLQQQLSLLRFEATGVRTSPPGQGEPPRQNSGSPYTSPHQQQQQQPEASAEEMTRQRLMDMEHAAHSQQLRIQYMEASMQMQKEQMERAATAAAAEVEEQRRRAEEARLQAAALEQAMAENQRSAAETESQEQAEKQRLLTLLSQMEQRQREGGEARQAEQAREREAHARQLQQMEAAAAARLSALQRMGQSEEGAKAGRHALQDDSKKRIKQPTEEMEAAMAVAAAAAAKASKKPAEGAAETEDAEKAHMQKKMNQLEREANAALADLPEAPGATTLTKPVEKAPAVREGGREASAPPKGGQLGEGTGKNPGVNDKTEYMIEELPHTAEMETIEEGSEDSMGEEDTEVVAPIKTRPRLRSRAVSSDSVPSDEGESDTEVSLLRSGLNESRTMHPKIRRSSTMPSEERPKFRPRVHSDSEQASTAKSGAPPKESLEKFNAMFAKQSEKKSRSTTAFTPSTPPHTPVGDVASADGDGGPSGKSGSKRSQRASMSIVNTVEEVKRLSQATATPDSSSEKKGPYSCCSGQLAVLILN